MLTCPFRRWSSRARSRSGRCCRRFCTCPGRTSCRPAASSCRGTPTAISPSASSPGSSAARCRRGWSRRPSRGCATPASIAGADPAVEGAGGRPPRLAAGGQHAAISSTWPRRGTTMIAKDVAEQPAGAAGHHPDRAGVVRRRGPRADRRGGPGGRAGARHAAGGAAGRVLCLDRRQPATAGASRSRSATSVLVCDVGGGTTDLTLIAVSEEAGQLVLTRVAVGDHILLGGDNMDLALAHTAAQAFAGARASSSTPGRCTCSGTAAGWPRRQLFSDAEAGQRAGDGAGPRQPGHRRHASRAS